MKFLRTIRFDSSDDNVFENAAAPDEWAIPGAFVFAQLSETDITGKTKQAFSNGFLSLESFAHSTFTSVAEIEEAELEEVEGRLARHFVDVYGAPDVETAMPAAKEEASFVLDLCESSLINTIFTVRRSFSDDGQIREEFRTIKSPDTTPMHSRIWNVVEDDV